MTRRLKIVHISSAHPLMDNRVFWKECCGLQRRGHEVVLICAAEKDEVIDDVQILAVPKSRSRLLRITLTVARVCRRAIKQKADIYHFHDPELLPFVRLFSLLGRRVVFDMHENLPKAIEAMAWLGPVPIRKAVARVTKLFEPLLYWHIPVVYAEDSYPKDYPFVRRSVMVRNFPDLDVLLTIDSEKHATFSLAYMGRVTPNRGSAVMVQAVRQLLEKGVDVELHCVGSGDVYTGVEPETPLPQVKEYGFLAAAEGYKVVAQCQVGLAILANEPNSTESYPTKIFEYMALGIPVITSDFPLYRSVVEKHDCGYCVEPSDVGAVVERLKYLQEHPEEQTRLGENGKQAVQKHFSWAVELDKLEAFYSEITEPSASCVHREIMNNDP